MAHGEIRSLFGDITKKENLGQAALEAVNIFANATDSLLTQQRILIAKQDEIAQLEAFITAQVINEQDPVSGKATYSNEMSRKAEITLRLNSQYKHIYDELGEIELNIKEADKIREVAKTTLKALEIVSALNK